MPDYVYLLDSRLSIDQRNALRLLREAAREAEMILFLVGDAVRDLTSGHAVRDIEIAVHGNALKLKKSIEKAGAKIWGEDEASRSLYLCFPGTVRVDVVSTHRVEYPKPGKAVLHPASIHEDLRRRDFTVNAMAISLNEGSYGLLMDPLNGAADIEGRTLRLVSNYGFLEEPALLIRATRYKARLGWELDLRTEARYNNARGEGVIEFLSSHARSRELEQIGHEEEGLKVLRALESEGWMQVLFSAWTAAAAEEERLQKLHELEVDLLMQGVHADISAAQMSMLTAKLAPKDLAALKKLMLRPGFVEEWNSLDAIAAAFAKVLLAKENLKASASFRLFVSYDPEAVLWLGFTAKDPAVLERYNLFLKEWPQARQRIPHALMQEMRITPELPGYADLVQNIFLELIDGGLSTPEEMRTFLEPHSPPAPPPQVAIKRTRAKRGEGRIKERTFEDEEEETEEEVDSDEELEEIGGEGEEEEIDLEIGLPKADIETELGEEPEEEVEGGAAEEFEAEEEEELEPAPAKKQVKEPKKAPVPAPAVAKAAKTAPPAPPAPGREAAKAAAKPVSVTQAAAPAAKPAPEVKKPAPAPAKAATPAKAPAKPLAKPAPKPAPKAPARAAAHKPAKLAAKAAPAKPAQKAPPQPAKKAKPSPPPKAAKPAAKKPAAKPAKKR
ncbi:MAG TPA: hypothetical protein VMA34_14440 [Terracidiphilus sp.]|nr:hypothetical protein [Terracidiphilus sp.]